jgi:hypothetical protein
MTFHQKCRRVRGRLFEEGRSGNPGSRRRASRNKATLGAAALLVGESQALTRKAVEMALSGDPTAMRLCMERVLPRRRERTVKFSLPPIEGVLTGESGDCIGRGRPVVRRLVHELTTLHAARWRGDLSHRVPGRHMAAAQGAVGAGAYPALANDPKLAAAGYPVLVVVNGSRACRRSAHCSMTSRWRRWSTTSALISATLTRTAFRRPT